MVDTGWPGEAAWSPELRAAMDRVGDTMRRFADTEVAALRAALSIALAELAAKSEAPVYPELVIQYAEEDISFSALDWRGEEVEVTIPAGTFYPVCPLCCRRTSPTAVEDGSEYRRTYWELDEIEGSVKYALLYGIGDSDDFSCDTTYLLCNQRDCWGRLEAPEWLEATYG